MALIRWSPFLDPFEEMDRHFMRPTDGFVPAVDVYETKDAVIIESPLAGVDPKDVDVSVDNNVLTIKGESEKKSEVEEENYYRHEIRHGSFQRQIALPASADGEKAEASFEKGLLKVNIPKKAEPKDKSIKVDIKE